MALAKKIQTQVVRLAKGLGGWIIKEEQMLLRQWRRLKKALIHCSKWAWYGTAAFFVLAAVVITALRIYLPEIENRKADIESYISKKSGYHVTIEKIDTYWDGLNPGIRANGVRVFNKDKKELLTRFKQVRASLVLLPLLWRSIEVHELVVVEPKMAFERMRDGRYRIRGLGPIRKSRKKQDPESFVNFLFSQRLLAIENGEITWRDYKTREKPIRVKNLNLFLKNNGNRHTLAFTARFPEKLCRSCSFIIGIEGNPLVDKKDWRGQMVLNTEGVNLESLPRVIREKIPAKLRGTINTKISSHWEEGLPTAVHGAVELSKLHVGLKQLKQPIRINHFLADTTMTRSGQQVQIDLNNLVVTLRKQPWSVGRLRFKYHKARSSLQVKSIDIGELRKLAMSLNIKHKAFAIVEKLKPSGVISNLNLNVSGKIRKPDDFRLTADLNRLFILPYRKGPGVEGLSGRFQVSKKSGKFVIAQQPFILSMPRYFRYPIEVLHAEGALTWKKFDEHWQVNARDLRARARDAEGIAQVSVKVPVDRTISPWVKLRVDFWNGNGANAKRYLPINTLTKNTIKWFDGALRSGEVTRGYVIYDAAARVFPKTRDLGEFVTVAHVKNADFRFLPGWHSVKDADVDLKFVNSSMQVTATTGELEGLDVRRLVVQSDELGKNSSEPIYVSATLAGDTASAITVLRQGMSQYKDNPWRHLLAPGLRGSGRNLAHFTLALNQKNFKKYRLDGEYIADNNSLYFPVAQLNARAIRGPVVFNEDGIQGGSLQGRFLGGVANLKIQAFRGRRSNAIVFEGNGSLTGRGIGITFGEWLRPYLSGKGSWKGKFVYRNNKPNLSFTADTSGLSLHYPKPLDKKAGFIKSISLRTLRSSSKRHLMVLRAGRKAGGLFEFLKPRQTWDFSRGTLDMGHRGGRLPRSGLHISATTDYLNADNWYYQVIKKQRDGDGLPEFITRISGSAAAIDAFSRRYGKTSVDLTRKGKVWRGSIKGKQVRGNMRLVFSKKSNDFRFKLARLVIPDPKPGSTDKHDPNNVPILFLEADSLRFQKQEFGKLKLVGWPINNGWKLNHFEISNKAMTLKSDGTWTIRNGQQWSEVKATLVADDVGTTLNLLDNPDFVKGGNGELKAKLRWHGAPYDLHYASMSGSVDFKARSGRFLQVDEGVGRMLGVLNITSLMRYLVLDFRPIFSKGFAFKDVDGIMRLSNGNAQTSIFVKGKSAHLDINGDVNLAEETYNLVMGVTPQLGGSVAGAGALLWNPATAFWLWLTQKVFKRKIDKKTRTLYTIKGTWKNPVIKKLPKPKGQPDGKKTEDPDPEDS